MPLSIAQGAGSKGRVKGRAAGVSGGVRSALQGASPGSEHAECSQNPGRIGDLDIREKLREQG